jgi:hypothetical protein
MTTETTSNWRIVADAMKSFIGKQECQCVSTPEYAEWETKMAPIMESKTPAERMLYLIFESPEFANNGIAEECERCRLLDQYWQAESAEDGGRTWLQILGNPPATEEA